MACRGGGRGPWPPGGKPWRGRPPSLWGLIVKRKLGLGQCRINLVTKVAYATGPALSRAPRSLCLRGVFLFICLLKNFGFCFFACRFFPQGPGGGGRRCKHWPPGAGDPRYATARGRCKHWSPGRWRPSVRHCWGPMQALAP